MSEQRFRPSLEPLEQRDLMSSAPLVVSGGEFAGMAISRGGDSDGRYDLQPAVLYDPSDTLDANRNGIPDRLYKMWWLGRYQPGDPNPAPSNLLADDRIYIASSEDGVNWNGIQPVLKGSGGIRGEFSADDHLLGSPAVLKVGGKYYLFYEAYSTAATPLNRFYSFTRGDNWITNDKDLPTNPAEGYAFERNLGFAPWLVKAGTHPIYSGEVVYSGGKHNRYLSSQPPFVGQRDGFQWSARAGGQPVFWLYDSYAPGRKAIYSFFDLTHSNTYATDNPLGDTPNSVLVETLGYAAESLDGPDMIGSDQNRIVMATSTDGVNWTRFQGPMRGGAIIVPQNERTSHYNPGTWTIERGYGSGFPSVLERDGYLELYFTDAVTTPGQDLRRVRLPLSQIENPEAWRQARAPGAPGLNEFAGSGGDLKWSPTLQRYFATYIRAETSNIPIDDPNYRQTAMVLWSDVNPDPNHAPTFPAGNGVDLAKGAGRQGAWGGLAADGLGHVLNQAGDRLDVYFEAFRAGRQDYDDRGPPVWDSDLAHAWVRFVPPPPPPSNGEASGVVFRDRNANFARDADEEGLAGWVVYHDANGNGRRDAGELSTTSDASGTYRLQLSPGFYGLRLEGQPGWAHTAGANGHGVTIGNGVGSSGNHFGVFRVGTIQGKLYRDSNRNGRQDAGEPPLVGWVVYLDSNTNGRLDAGELQTTTDSQGRFQFVVRPGTYRLRVVVQSGFANPGGRTVTVAGGGTVSQNFGIVRS